MEWQHLIETYMEALCQVSFSGAIWERLFFFSQSQFAFHLRKGPNQYHGVLLLISWKRPLNSGLCSPFHGSPGNSPVPRNRVNWWAVVITHWQANQVHSEMLFLWDTLFSQGLYFRSHWPFFDLWFCKIHNFNTLNLTCLPGVKPV